jgi:membrane dipeptidase
MCRATTVVLLLPAALLADEPKRKPIVLTDEARAIQKEALLVDGHNDLPWQYREKKDLSFQSIDIRRPQKALHTDIPRLREGGVGAQFWAAFVPASTRKDGSAVKMTLEQIDVIHRFVKGYPEAFEFARTADDIERIHKAGKIASLIGVEGGHSIDDSLGVLRCYYDLGVRYMTLTHSETLDWADSATDEPKSKGLSPFGEDVVHEMNRLGMMVDLSHVSADTMRHTLRITKVPVIFSHSSAFALADHPRNVPDDVLKQMPKNGGIVMVNFYSGFIVPEAARMRKKMFETARELKKKYPEEKDFQEAMAAYRKDNPIPRGSIYDVVDHIEHIIKTAGIDHVGLGSDFDGIDSTPEQLDDVSKYPLITQELLNRGYKKEAILKVLGGNFLRVFRAIEAAKAK